MDANRRVVKKDLIGKKIGNITVMSIISSEPKNEVFKCRCDCGNIIDVKRRYLVDESKTHCGCKNRKDMVGYKVGRLTVLSFAGIGKHHTAMWLCKCDCGNEKVVDGALLRSGLSKSCGCLFKDAVKAARKKYNSYSVCDNVVRVKLSNSDKEMLCDIDDWDRLKQYCWMLNNDGYATTNLRTKASTTTFYGMIIDCPPGYVRDHINRNRLDNRKENLRVVTPLENARNTSASKNNPVGHVGVSYSKRYRKYVVQISVNRKVYHLGKYDNLEDAISARIKGEEKYFGKVYSIV